MLALYYAPSTVGPGVAYCALRDGRRVRSATDRLRSAEQTKPECHALNPKGRAPALVAERAVLTETPAILAVGAQSYHEARLAPLYIVPERLSR
jgi:glutathione S-transferase